MVLDPHAQQLVGLGVTIFLWNTGDAIAKYLKAKARTLLAEYNLKDEDDD